VNPGTYKACRGFALDWFGKLAILFTLAPPATAGHHAFAV
jgi:hypothetical protein